VADRKIVPLTLQSSELRERWMTTSIGGMTSNLVSGKTRSIVGQKHIHEIVLASKVKSQRVLLEARNAQITFILFRAMTENSKRIQKQVIFCRDFAERLLNSNDLITLMESANCTIFRSTAEFCKLEHIFHKVGALSNTISCQS
jgi:hypothetical protein